MRISEDVDGLRGPPRVPGERRSSWTCSWGRFEREVRMKMRITPETGPSGRMILGL